MISSKILSEYLNEIQFFNHWLDARDYIKTDSNYREGIVNWQETEQNISKLDKINCYVTQGFIGSESNNFTVTLGREGSDYTAAIFAYCLNADEMTIWKDVPGVMTGDPRKFENVELLSHISYEEAIEMAYYGASVIHPKTLQPLKQKNIPFFVKSFVEPKKPGTKVGNSEENELIESYILKENIQLPSIYFSHEREVLNLDNQFIAMNEFVNLDENDVVTKEKVRYRTVGDMTCTAAVLSEATNLEQVIAEIITTKTSERGETRIDDRTSEAAMEDRKKAGYF